MRSISTLIADAYGMFGARLVILLLVLVVTGVSDGLSLALLLPLLEILGVGTSASVAPPSGIQSVFLSVMSTLGINVSITSVSIVVMTAFVIQMALFLLQSWYMASLTKSYVATRQSELFNTFMQARWRFFLGERSGYLLNAIVTEVPRVGSALHAIMQMAVAIIIAAIYLLVSLAISWKATLLLFVIAALLFAVVWPVRSAIRRLGGEIGGINAALANTLSELFTGAKLVKASAAEHYASTLIDERVENLRQNLLWSQFLPAIVRVIFELSLILILLGGLVWGIKLLGVSMAQFLVICALVVRLFPKMLHVQQFYNLINLNVPAHQALVTLHSQAQDLAEPVAPTVSADSHQVPADPVDITVKGLEVARDHQTVLHDLNLDIPAGSFTGIIGRSGAGKSTLVDCFLGLVHPSAGRIEIGAETLENLNLQTWRSRIGYVPQEAILFNDTIANNISWGLATASDEEIVAAAHKAGLKEFLDGLPEGIHTQIADRGGRLSGGQRQRVSLARALLRKPILLILDEATSALDADSERNVMDVIEGLRGGITVIVIAHRLSVLQRADRLYLIDAGRVRAKGTWDELAKTEPAFMRAEDGLASTAGPARQ